ncbi:response regulator transcription factor [Candidatus Falkowbacteria bacterium]|nr:response regulator transcription factor [Candidatus Falkowbacteria bacterium]
MAKFLIIDDNIVMTSGLLAKMRLAGHEADVVGESTVSEPVITLARVRQPDMIVIDPTLDSNRAGYGLISDLKAHPETKDILIVAYSDLPDLSLRERVLNLGASTHYDRSSMSAEELIGRLEKIIINKQKYDA